MAVSDGELITVMKDMGLVPTCSTSASSGACAATSRSATPATRRPAPSTWRNAQPAYRDTGRAGFALGPQRQPDQHRRAGRDGRHAPGPGVLRQRPGGRAAQPGLPPRTRAAGGRRRARTGLRAVLPRLEGAFSFVLCDVDRLIGVRDPTASGPSASAGWSGGEPAGWVLASETPALDVIGAHFVRELEPGEMVVIDADGCARRGRSRPNGSSRACASSSSSTSPGPTPSSTATRCTGPGAAWAAARRPRRPVEADMVMGVPDSGVPAAEGYAVAQRHPLRAGAGEEPLHRAHVHRPRPGTSAPAECAASSTRCATTSPASGSSWWTTRSSGARRPGHGHDAPRGRARRGAPAHHLPAVPVAVLLRHGHGRPRRAAGRQPARRRDRPSSSASTASPTSSSTTCVTAIDAPGAGFCTACLTGRVPGAGAGADRRARRPQRGGRRPGVTGALPDPGPNAPHRPTRASRHRRPSRSRRDGGSATYAGAGVDIGGRRAGRRPHPPAGPTPPAPRSGRRPRWVRRPVRPRRPALPRARPGGGHRRRRHEVARRRSGRPVRHGRHRPGRHVRRRPRLPGGRAAVLPRLPRRRAGSTRTGWPQLVGGVAEGCRQAGGALLGRGDGRASRGDGAGAFDLAGFAVGVVERDELLDGTGSRPETSSSGLASPGLRCNGYSLARQVLLERAGLPLDGPAWEGAATSLADELLRPSVIYTPAVRAAAAAADVHAVAHITGGGLAGNLPRALPEGARAVVDRRTWTVPAIFGEIRRLGRGLGRGDGERLQPRCGHGPGRCGRRRRRGPVGPRAGGGHGRPGRSRRGGRARHRAGGFGPVGTAEAPQPRSA